MNKKERKIIKKCFYKSNGKWFPMFTEDSPAWNDMFVKLAMGDDKE